MNWIASVCVPDKLVTWRSKWIWNVDFANIWLLALTTPEGGVFSFFFFSLPSKWWMKMWIFFWCLGFLWFWHHLASLVLSLLTFWLWETGIIRTCVLDVRDFFWRHVTRQHHLPWLKLLKRYKGCLSFSSPLLWFFWSFLCQLTILQTQDTALCLLAVVGVFYFCFPLSTSISAF